MCYRSSPGKGSTPDAVMISDKYAIRGAFRVVPIMIKDLRSGR